MTNARAGSFLAGWGAVISVCLSLLIAASAYMLLQRAVGFGFATWLHVAALALGTVLFSLDQPPLMRLRSRAGGWREVLISTVLGSVGMTLYLVGFIGLIGLRF